MSTQLTSKEQGHTLNVLQFYGGALRGKLIRIEKEDMEGHHCLNKEQVIQLNIEQARELVNTLNMFIEE